ncbi:MAG: ATP-grasp domain-containing protein [Oscillospiraceae bacterium]|nr:ATP-grasp domain-containing protein [Oscillospiraceae bacterium]
MTAIVTDAHYRMSVSLIRDLVGADVRVIACELDIYDEPVGFACRSVSRRVRLPKDDYMDALYTLCEEEFSRLGEKPALLPVGAATLSAVAAQRARFDEVCALCIPTTEQLLLFNDKSAVGALGKYLGIPVPEVFTPQEGESLEDFAARIPYPCVVKPLCGEKFGLPAASRYAIVHSDKKLLAAYRRFEELTGSAPIVQQYLTGEGCGCSILAKDGEVLCAISHRRVREYPITGGPSSCCEVISNDLLLPAVQALVRETGYTGVGMFEFKLDAEGAAHLLEVNPRIWGTYPLTRASNSNFSLCWLHASVGSQLPDYAQPQAVRMVYYPSDLAAGIRYALRGQFKKAFGALRDRCRKDVKNGLHEASDPKPSRIYLHSLFKKGGRHGNPR